MATNQDFSGKYLKTNFVTSFLLDNFFGSIAKITAGLPEVRTVLEVGCGPGFSTVKLQEMLPKATFEASDIEASLVQEAQKRNPDIKITQESIYSLPRQNKAFDLVFCLEVLEHLEKPELALVELHRVSSRYVLLSVPCEPIWRILNMVRLKYLKNLGNTPGHLNHWTKPQFASLVSAQFKVKRITTSLPWIIILAEK